MDKKKFSYDDSVTNVLVIQPSASLVDKPLLLEVAFEVAHLPEGKA